MSARPRALFRDRVEGGRLLAERLGRYGGPETIVLALPRGGVPVGAEVARLRRCDLDVFLVRKLGLPGQEELAMGAIASGGVRVLNEELVSQLRLSPEVIDRVVDAEARELERRERLYRGRRPPPGVRGRTAILVDDGLATGATMRAAVAALRRLEPRRIVVAVPVAPPQTIAELRDEVDELVVLAAPHPFHAVGLWYTDFSEVRDEDVQRLLRPPGDLTVPEHARGLVVFAHGSGSSHASPRNRMVAGVLQERRFATYLFDLLEPGEEDRRFDVGLLAERLETALDRVGHDGATAELDVGVFGASTGAAAALLVAARRPDQVHAVVSRGGRPDLAGQALADVRAPTLLIVGSRDEQVLALNRDAAGRMSQATVELEVVEGATHLFEEPGALERVAELARGWFERFLSA